MATLLVIDDDRSARRTLQLAFEAHLHVVVTAGTKAEGYKAWVEHRPDVILLDLMLPDGTGQQLLEQAGAEDLGGIVIMITGHQDLEKAVAAMQGGAFDYIHKPLDIDELEITVEKALSYLASQRNLAIVADLGGGDTEDRIVGVSRAMVELHKQIGIISRGRANVLITGESGTGKELAARVIHRHSDPDQPFIPVNCSALVPTLLESELFGHEKGAFTGAIREKTGRMELAGAGTLFLDEIGDLDASLQVKLLRVFQERVFERVGGTKSLPFRARVISATHRDLKPLLEQGSFRQDLYYRLNVVSIHLPPLRERLDDLNTLVEHLLVKANRSLHRNVSKVPGEVLKLMQAYWWPGNVRELENRIHVAVMSSPGDTLSFELPGTAADSALTRDLSAEPHTAAAADWRRTLNEVEKEHIKQVLEGAKHNYGEACRILGISRPTLRRKLREYGLRKE